MEEATASVVDTSHFGRVAGLTRKVFWFVVSWERQENLLIKTVIIEEIFF